MKQFIRATVTPIAFPIKLGLAMTVAACCIYTIGCGSSGETNNDAAKAPGSSIAKAPMGGPSAPNLSGSNSMGGESFNGGSIPKGMGENKSTNDTPQQNGSSFASTKPRDNKTSIPRPNSSSNSSVPSDTNPKPASGNVGTKVGDMAPEITGSDLNGTEFSLSDYRGKVIMLDFWGDW